MKFNELDDFKDFTKMKIFFSKINVNGKNLTSLEGRPEIVRNNFDCSNNELTTLEHCSSIVERSFDCSNNKLETLQYCPKQIFLDFDCSHNKLSSLKITNSCMSNCLISLITPNVSFE